MWEIRVFLKILLIILNTKEFSEMKEKSKVNLIQASSQSQALVEEMKDM